MLEEIKEQTSQTMNLDSTDIKHQLYSDADQLLESELKEDKNTSVATTTQITTNHDLSQEEMISNELWLSEYAKRLYEQSSQEIFFEYHQSEINNVAKVLNCSLFMFAGVTFVSFLLTAICIFLENNSGAIITSVLGLIIDGILGLIVKILNTTLRSKKSYFDSEYESTKLNKMLLILQTITDQKEKNSIIVDILRKHFNIDKNN